MHMNWVDSCPIKPKKTHAYTISKGRMRTHARRRECTVGSADGSADGTLPWWQVVRVAEVEVDVTLQPQSGRVQLAVSTTAPSVNTCHDQTGPHVPESQSSCTMAKASVGLECKL